MERLDVYMISEIVGYLNMTDRMKVIIGDDNIGWKDHDMRVGEIRDFSRVQKMTHRNINREGKTDMKYSIEWGIIEYVNYYIHLYENEKKVMSEFAYISGKRGQLNVIKILLGIVNERDNKRYGGYMMAGGCVGGHIDIIEYLVVNGIEVNRSMVYYSHIGDNEKMIRHIERYIQDNDLGLMGACCSGNLNRVNELIKRGANNWEMGLSGAVYGKKGEIVRMMVKMGANGLNQALLGKINVCDVGETKQLIDEGICDWRKCYALVLLSGRNDIMDDIIRSDVLKTIEILRIYWSVRHAIPNVYKGTMKMCNAIMRMSVKRLYHKFV